MARVPQQETRTVAPQAIPTVFQSSREATIDAFGGAEAAQALQSGRQLSAAADDLERVALKVILEDNEREAKRGDTALRQRLQRIQHGDGTAANPGYLSTLNDEAIANHALTLQDIDKALAETLSEAGNSNIAGLIQDSSRNALLTTINNVNKHANDQRRSANILMSENRIEQAKNDAATTSDVLGESLRIAVGEGLALCRLSGLPKDSENCSVIITQTTSTVLDGAIRGDIARGDLQTASDIYEKAKQAGMIDGDTRTKLDNLFDSEIRQTLNDIDSRDARAFRRIKREQTIAYGDIVTDILAGQGSESDITQAFETRQIDATQRDRANKVLKTFNDPPAEDDLTSLVDLNNRFDRGVLTGEDLDIAFANGSLKSSTYNTFRGKLRSADPILDRADVKRIRLDMMERIAGLIINEYTKYEEGLPQKLTEARRQYNTEVELDPKNAQAIADRISNDPAFATEEQVPGIQLPRPSDLRGTMDNPDIEATYKASRDRYLKALRAQDGSYSFEEFAIQTRFIEDLEDAFNRREALRAEENR